MARKAWPAASASSSPCRAADSTKANALEHVKTYLNGVFGFIGITPEFVHADGVNYGPEQREAGIAKGPGGG